MGPLAKTRRTVLTCALLGAVTLAAFGPVLRNGFVSYDDRDYVTENPHTAGGLTWASAGWAFRTAHAGNWHPLTWLSHLADVVLFGLKAGGHHGTSLLLHGANAVLLFLLLQRLTGAFWRSVCVAALFALHPLHVESVAWVAERKDVLSTLFFLLTLWTYAGYARRSVISGQWSVASSEASAAPGVDDRQPATDHGRAGRPTAFVFYLASLGCFALGLMSKPMLVTLPFVLLLLDFWPLQRLQRSTLPRLVIEKAPFLALSTASSVITFVIQRGAGAVSSLEALPLGFRVFNALVSYVRYVLKMVCPARLAVFYPAPAEWPAVWIGAAALALAGVSVLAIRWARRAPWFAFGWLWYLGTLVPVIGIVQVGQQAMADRYSYIPLIGLFVAVAWAGGEAAARWPGTKVWLAAGAAAGIAACALLTWKQTGYWRNSASLFAHALAVTRDNAVAHNNLGVVSLEEGKLAAAERHFAEAVRLKPNYPEGLGNLGLCREKQGRLVEAERLFRRSLTVQPTAPGHYNLANLLSQQGKLAEAQAHYEAALRLKPEFVAAWYNLGLLQIKQGRPTEAARNFEAALGLNPAHAESHLSLGVLLVGQDKPNEAIAHFREAVRAAPDNADAHFNLAFALNGKGDYAGAAAEFARVCRLHPEDVEARASLALALLSGRKMSEAARELREVVRVRPDARTHYYLALVLDSQGRAQEAQAHYREAARLSPNTGLYLNDLAWSLATNPKPELRDGAEAVRLAQQACALSGGKEPRFQGTLDAALAEVGRFADALAAAAKTRELALAAGQPDLARQAEERMALYRAGKPHRTAAPAAAAP
jgi:protein O-mannosyl-transferase